MDFAKMFNELTISAVPELCSMRSLDEEGEKQVRFLFGLDRPCDLVAGRFAVSDSVCLVDFPGELRHLLRLTLLEGARDLLADFVACRVRFVARGRRFVA